MLGIAIFSLIGLAVASQKHVTYTSSVHLLVYNRQIMTGPDAVILPGRADVSLVQNQIEILQSRSVLMKVIENMELDADPEYVPAESGLFQLLKNAVLARSKPPVDEKSLAFGLALESLRRSLKTTRVGTSHTVMVSVKASNPDKAARVANEVARAFLQERDRTLDSRASKAPALRELYQGLGPSAYVISDAEPPIRPDGPPGSLIVIGAAVLGLGAGAFGAVLLDFLDDTLRNPDQLEAVLGMECLGAIPRLQPMDRGGGVTSQHNIPSDLGELLASIAQHHCSTTASTLQSVRAAIHDSSSHDVCSIGVTSAVPGEGVTTIAIGLAQMIAGSGRRVLLITSRPTNSSLPHPIAPGVRTGAAGSARPRSSFAADAVVDERSGLHILPVGDGTDADDDLVQSTILDTALREASGSYDFVIVDLPSLVSGADVRALAHVLDGLLLVVKWGETNSGLLSQAVQSVGEARRKFIGAVLNMADEKMISLNRDRLSASEVM